MDLDIIIPCYNAKDTLWKSLSSIMIQKVSIRYCVYLINDCSDYNYKDFVDYFSHYFRIKEIKLKKNVGPGMARNEGIRKSNGTYIMFMDSDDYLNHDRAIMNIYNKVSNNYDMVVSDFIYERDGERVVKKKNLVWLHGKMYRRSFLERYSISFNDTRANEDNGFNRLILLMNPSLAFISDVTYVYSENINSITRRNNRQYKLDGLEGFVNNMIWACEEGIKRDSNIKDIANVSVNTLIAMYYYYLELYDDYDVEKLVKWSKPMKVIFDKYRYLISDDDIYNFLEEKNLFYISEGKRVKKIITFDEYLKKIGDDK